MSTRSGKRLHNASNENTEPELLLKNDRKTRSKHVVENSDSQGAVLKKKKRQNYVTFPSEEDNAGVNSLEDEVPTKSARALRWQTLKEQNAASEDVETVAGTKTQIRCTRRTKKFSETEEVPDIPVNEDPIVSAKPLKGKKNKKKSKKGESEVNNKENVKMGKKKKNKKKNSKSNTDEVEFTGKRKNDSGVSTDSFHSAAGSPLRTPVAPLNNSSPNQAGDAEVLATQNTSGIKRRLKRISGLHTSTKAMDVNKNIETEIELPVRASKRRRSSLKPVIPGQESTSSDTIEKDLNTTFEKETTNEGSSKKNRKSNLVAENTDPNTNLNIPKTIILNTTFEKDDIENDVKSNNKTDNKEQKIEVKTNASYEIRRSSRKSVNTSENTTTLNGTFDLSPKPNLIKSKSLDSTYDKESKLDSTFDKTAKPSLGSKSSLISSDPTNNSIISLDKSDNSKITDDDSKTENILNATPLLIESSMEESRVLESSLKENKTPESLPKPVTPLKREGTFTKDSPSMSPKQTPNKRQTLPAAGCTPYHSNGKGSQKRSVLNLTHSIEKPGRRSSLAEVPRATRVMFCSPVNNPGVATQQKSKIIKSNLKGSNKSFVFDESAIQKTKRAKYSIPDEHRRRSLECQSLLPSRLGRKRSLTHTDGEQAGAGAKRSRLAAAPPARPRTTSAMAKLSNAATPSKPATPKSEVKATKLPNFAALHARRFARMESLDECQQRKAERAKHLLVPTGSVAVLERSSPRVTLEPKPRDTPPKAATPAKPATKLPTLETLQRGYTRFGFKMHCDVNPFTVPPKTADKPKLNGFKPDLKPIKPNGVKPLANLKREFTPSLAGATSLRRAVAKQTIMREKSFTLAEKRNESRREVRTVIKGVRTNRRFELQMKCRNING